MSATAAEKKQAEAERAARVRAEHNSMGQIEAIAGVKAVTTSLVYHDQIETDKDGNEREVKRARLKAEAELADGRLIEATSGSAVELERLLRGRVETALRERPIATGQDNALAKKVSARAAWVRPNAEGGLDGTAELSDGVRVQASAPDSPALELALRDAVAKARKGK